MKPWLAAAGLMILSAACAAGQPVEFMGDGVRLKALLYRPAGPGPFPAVVLLHGCSGMWTAKGEPVRTYREWAVRLRDAGFLALLVDSFGPRGEKEICTQRQRRIRPGVERAADAHAARRWLLQEAEPRAAEVHVFGWSNGAMAALSALGRPVPTEDGFRTGVAFYPGCRPYNTSRYHPRAPLLIQAGEADDWTPAKHCRELVDRVNAAGGAAEIDVYPGAHHGFDRVGGRVRFRPEVRNPASPKGWGAHTGPDPHARTRSQRRAVEFLTAHTRTFHVEHRTAPGQMP